MPLTYGLIHPVDLSLADLPPKLQGLRIAHLSDLHITRLNRKYDRLISQLTSLRLDMVVFTGDYMTRGIKVGPTVEVMRRIVDQTRTRLGVYGVFGNHDSPELTEALAGGGIHWLGTGIYQIPDMPIQLMSIDQLGDDPGDSAAMLLNGPELDPAQLRLMLTHWPSWISTAADLGVDVMFTGHTHGGQIRLPNNRALYNSCDLPLSMSSGVLRHRDTLVAISRGLGEVGPPPLRIFCPPHIPVYTLRRGPTPGQPTQQVVRVLKW